MVETVKMVHLEKVDLQELQELGQEQEAGGGYYGGGAGANLDGGGGAGGGGTGYVNTSLLTDAFTIAGDQQMPTPDNYDVKETGHAQHGCAKITYIDE